MECSLFFILPFFSVFFCFVSILFQQIVRIYVNFYESSTIPTKIIQYVSRDYFHWAISRINFTLTIRRSLRNFTNENKTEQNSSDRCLNWINIQLIIRSIFCFIHDFNQSYLMLQQRLLKNCLNSSEWFEKEITFWTGLLKDPYV